MTLLRGASTGLFGVSLLAAHVYAQTVPFITTTSLPGGTAGAFYSQTLAATSGVSPYKNWTVVSGSLPPGLTLNAATGNISGTPTTAAGSPFSFSVTVQDNVNNTSPAQSLSIAIIAAATPIISGVIDTEDNSLPPLAPGSLASIYGTNLASTTANVTSVPAPFTLGGVSILVNGTPAALIFVSPNQINFQIPYETAAGNATITVTNSGSASAGFQFAVVPASPGIGFVQNPNSSVNSAANPIASGVAVTVYFTGLGATNPPVADGAGAPASAPLATPVASASVTVGGLTASVLFIGLAPGLVGLGQANVVIPAALQPGTYALIVTVNGRPSKAVTVYISGAAPSVTSVTPNTVPVGSAATAITISGSNFGGGSTVSFTPPGGVATPITPSTIQATQILATVPAAMLTAAGTAQVAVTNGLGTVSNQVPLTITPPQTQTITFAPLNNVSFGVAPFTIGGSASSGLTVSFASNSLSVCTVNVTTVTIVGTGTCSITASQAGNGNYTAATPVTQTFTVSSLNLPLGPNLGNYAVGPNQLQIPLSATGGTPPYHYSLTPGTPAILGLRVQDGQPLPANGTNFPPSVTGGILALLGPGSYSTSVRVTDSTGVTFDRPINFSVLPIDVISFQGGLPRAIVNSPYSFQFTPYGGSGTYIWGGTGLPPGLTINSSTGVLSGTPQSAGAFNLVVNLADAAGGGSIGRTETLIVSPFAITDSPVLPQATANSAYSYQFNAPNCGAGCIWTIYNGNLPAGFNLSGTGMLTGTFTTASGSESSFYIQASGSGGMTQKRFSLAILPTMSQPLSITDNISQTSLILGSNRAIPLIATGGTPPYTFTLLSGSLPPGMSLQGPGETIGDLQPGYTYIAGWPEVAGTYNFTIQVTDSASNTATQAFSVPVSIMEILYSNLPISTNSLIFNTPYSQQMLVVGGTGNYTSWTTSAPIYPGLSLDPATGLITGTPTITGVNFTILTVTDSAGNTVSSFVGINAASENQSQTITFAPLSNVNDGVAPFTISATASSGLAVSFASNMLSVCTVNVATVTIVGTGNCSITASQAGNGTYAPTTPMTQAFTVNISSQTITFAPLNNVSFGIVPFTVSATASSGLAVSFASNMLSVCTVNGTTVTIVGTGTCSITTSQAGNGTYSAATPVTQTFTVSVGSQTITFDAIPNQIIDISPFPVAAQSSARLPVAINSTTSAVCTTASGLVTILHTGTCSIMATQGGNANATAATPVTRSFTVSQAISSNTFAAATGNQFAVGLHPISVASGDFNGDGKPDLAIANINENTVTVLLGNGAGGFAPASGSAFAAGAGPVAVAVGDFNGDGIQDLALANYNGNTVTVLLGNGAGGFAAAPHSPFGVGASPQSVAVGDFNGDGIQDLAIANIGVGSVTVLMGDGLGGFAQVTGPFAVGTSPISVAVGDFNGDGFQDLVTANYGAGSATVLLGNGAGGFSAASGSPLTLAGSPSFVAVGDFNGDGIPDLAATSSTTSTVLVLLGKVSGGFSAATSFPVGSSPFAVAVADFNGDGIPDLATASDGGTTVTVLLGDGLGGFTPAPGSPFTSGTNPVSLAVADFNGDGIEDLAAANLNGNNVTVLLGGGASPVVPASITTTTLPGGTVGTAYSQTLAAANGVSPYKNWTVVSGSLPPGLTLNASTGVIGGTPTTATGSPFSFSVTVQDTANNTSAAQSLSIAIQAVVPVVPPTPPLTLTVSPGTISTTTGGSLSGSFTASGGTAPYKYSVSGLPSGITSGAGSLSGTPTQAGNFNATVTVTDSNMSSASASIAINVLGLTTTALSNGTAGQLYTASLSAAGGTGMYSFAATGLPAGLSFTSYGYLNGTVKTAGTYPISVTVSSGGLTAGATLSLTIAQPQALSISQVNGLVTGPSGTVNVPYSQTLAATGGVPPYTWSALSGTLPPGLSLNASGIVSGTPTAPGSFSFGVQVVDTAGASATSTASVTIQPAPLVITTMSLPSGVNGVDYPQQQLTVSGGVSPYTWALASGSSLPTGMLLSSSGVLNGVPGVAGSFSVGVVVTDHASAQGNAAFQLVIRPAGADLILTTSSLTFSLSSPATSPPASQVVGVQSTMPSQPLTYSLAVNPVVPWLALTNGTTTPDSIQAAIVSAALTLSPGSYQTTITATCTSGSCSGHTQSVGVTLTVTAVPPQLSISTGLVSFATTNTALGTLTQPINIQNAGGGTLGFASISCEAPWCAAGPAPSSLGGGASAAIPVTVSPALLGPGFYRTQVDIASSGGKGSVPVTLFISANSTMTLAPAGGLFNQPAGSAPGNPNGSFLVSVNSSNPVNFSAAVLPGASWLLVGSAAGTSTTTEPGTVSYSIDPAVASGLAVGAYYGEIEVTSADVSNSPQDFEVVLNVAPAPARVVPDPEPGGLLFITTVGGVLPPQTVTVYSGSPGPLTFQASAATTSGGGWLSVTPATGSASQSSPGVTTVSVNTSKLTAGVYQGGVSYSLSATAVRTVGVTLIVTSTGGTGGAIGVSTLSSNAVPRASGCTPTRLVPAQTGLVQSFFAPAGWPTPLSVLLFDDCGSVVNNGQIVATFSNGDPPLALPLANPSQGLYSGTWSPASPSSQVTINVTASAPNFTAATSPLSGEVAPNAVPLLAPNGTLHSFNPLVGAALAPGTIVQIYGQNLASTTGTANAVPLPNTMNNSSVIIGGMQAPLYYVSPGQIDAQIPFELQSGQQYQVIVSANGALTTPQPIQLSATAPGLAADPDGTLIAQHSSDGSLVSQTSPARGGEYLVAYLAGLGDTTVPVTSGTPSPSSPLAQPSNTPVLTINGAQAPIYFAGLTPGLVGLYQINFQVPAGLPAGNIMIVVSQNGQSSNQTTLPYQP